MSSVVQMCNVGVLEVFLDRGLPTSDEAAVASIVPGVLVRALVEFPRLHVVKEGVVVSVVHGGPEVAL